MVLVTVRVLPFLFLTVVLICSVTLLVSTGAASLAGAAADAAAGSGSSRWDVVTAATEAMACASSAPTGPASALATAAPRFQIAVAGVSIPDHSRPPRRTAPPAIAAVAHN